MGKVGGPGHPRQPPLVRPPCLGQTKKSGVLLDPDPPTIGRLTGQQWQDDAKWVTTKPRTYSAIIDDTT
jgi:hypothetical protein